MRRQQSCAAGAIGVMLVIGFGVATASAEEATPTFSEDVAPILYDFNWQTYYIFQLHIPGAAAGAEGHDDRGVGLV